MSSARIRVASVQLAGRTGETIDGLTRRISDFARIAAGFGAEFVVFPEHLTLQTLSVLGPEAPSEAAIAHLTSVTEPLKSAISDAAKRHGLTIIGGSHAFETEGGAIRNTAFVAHPDGGISSQEKLHPTPGERTTWGISGGNDLDVIETAHGHIGVLICYDSEFPEATRRLVDQGARILFVPYCTDTWQGHLRVRYCCHARTVENQVYVVTSGMVGTVHGVHEVDTHVAQSAILAPCDIPFGQKGILAEAEAGQETLIVADLDLGLLDWARKEGAVRNLADRRDDLYSNGWRSE